MKSNYVNEREVDLKVHESLFKEYKNFTIESEKTKNLVLQKMLSKSSKKISGNIGKPDFIVTSKEEHLSNFVMIIENKNGEENIDYSIDESIWYARQISSEYNVIAVGITGTRSGLKIVANYFKKGTTNFTKIFDSYQNTIPNFKYFLEKIEEKDKKELDDETLLRTSRNINKILRDELAVHEKKRPLLVSAILISLIDDEFASSYQFYGRRSTNSLATKIFETSIDILQNRSSNKNEKLSAMLSSLRFIKDLNGKSNDNKIIDVIDLLREEIMGNFNIIKTDVVGYFYESFIKYSTSGGGDLGINLTPAHIAKLMYDISGAKLNDLVFDPTMGTGTFLSHHWKQICEENADLTAADKEELAKSSVIGVELDGDMYTLAVMNMILHNDGMNNLIKGSCFDEDIVEEVKRKKPDIALSNPPYGVRGSHELEFTFNTLNMLKRGGVGVFIFPVSVLANRPDLNALKDMILSKHKLIASIEVPNNIFQTAAVKTVITVFEAHTPHKFGKDQVWFADFDDGYQTYNKGGRIPKNKLESERLHDALVKNFFARRESDNSFLSVINSHKEHLIYTAQNKVTFKLSEIAETFISNKGEEYIKELRKNNFDVSSMSWSIKNSKIDFNNIEVDEFYLTDVFKISRGRRWTKRDRENSEGSFPFVTATNVDNGVSNFVAKKDCPVVFMPGIITLNVFGKAFYQAAEFGADDNVRILTFKDKKLIGNKEISEFIVAALDQHQKIYSYGNKLQNEEKVKSIKILLPSKSTGEIDFEKIVQIYNSIIDFKQA